MTRPFNRPSRKSHGTLAAGSLGQIVKKKPVEFERKVPCRFGHNFIPGDEFNVCTRCGVVEEKE